MKKVSVKRIAAMATREVRVLPVLVAAAAALLLLKGVQIAVDAPGAISGARMALAQKAESGADEAAAAPGAETASGDAGAEAKPEGADDETVVEADAPQSAKEAINSRLADRRKDLDKLEADLKMRENLLRATELRIEQRLAELKSLESRINATLKQREEQEAERFKNLVTMYQAMKPKDAAKVFDRLDTQVLVEVASGMEPRQMAEIVSNMTPEGAERLTIALMNRAAQKEEGLKVQDLPQIVGTKPSS